MTPERIERTQLRVPKRRARMESLQGLLSQIRPIPAHHTLVLTEDKMIDDDSCY
jgi:hypothetical protein